MPQTSPSPQSSVPNLFAAANGLTLFDAQLDAYIDSSIQGADRTLAHTIMAQMPPTQRGDFVYLALSGHMFSNNPALLQAIEVTQEDPSTGTVVAAAIGRGLPQRIASHTAATAVRTPSSKRLPMYDAPCRGNPPDPPGAPKGPYVRQVSLCGFTAGWAFISVPCGPQNNFQPGDVGYLYWELAGNSGSLTEGGLQYNSDSSIQPYVKSSAYGFLTTKMANYSQHYTCSSGDLAIMHGATSDGSMSYTEVGLVPSTNCTPETNFCNYNIFALNSAAWLWFQSPGDYTGSSPDAAGVMSPCSGCTISRVTSIAQSGTTTYTPDGSTFGAYPGQASNYITWMQVAFGEWESNCMPGTTLCTFDYSAYPLTYYGGPQYYPNNTIASSNPNGALIQYGPYETYDGIDLSIGAVQRQALGAFKSQLPPPPCTMDSYGYCAVNTATYGTANCETMHIVGGRPVYYEQPYATHQVYSIATTNAQAGIATATITKGNTLCTPVTTTWSPGEPKVTFNDPNLP